MAHIAVAVVKPRRKPGAESVIRITPETEVKSDLAADPLIFSSRFFTTLQE
jgi:hypothetical protein